MTRIADSRANARVKVFGFMSVLGMSALIMVWLLWHHPVKTLLATLAVLAALGVSARLARSIEPEGPPRLHPGESA